MPNLRASQREVSLLCFLEIFFSEFPIGREAMQAYQKEASFSS